MARWGFELMSGRSRDALLDTKRSQAPVWSSTTITHWVRTAAPEPAPHSPEDGSALGRAAQRWGSARVVDG